MNYLLLTASQSQGATIVFILFLCCFIGVHAIQYALLKYRKEIESEILDEKKEKKESVDRSPSDNAASNQPVYYLFEKKRVKKKPKEIYAPPKKVTFDDGI